MNKDEYILRSLSKIRHKRWELFAISRIVQNLMMEDDDIEFVCQQLVRRPNGHALVDLFFPQFKICLEIDEPAHATAKNAANDHRRTNDIIDAAGLIERRITVYKEDKKTEKTLKEFACDVDAFISEVLNLKREAIETGTFEPWNFEDRYDPDPHIKRGRLSISTNPVFRYQRDALRCFGYKGGNYQRGVWSLPGDSQYQVWFPRLYRTKQWDNTTTCNGTKISERERYGDTGYKKIVRDDKNDKRPLKIVFAREIDNLGAVLYRFMGVFKFDPDQSRDDDRIYVRVENQVATINSLP